MLTRPKFSIDELSFTFSDGPNDDTIMVTLPCGCTADLMSKKSGGVNQFGNPMQFDCYCKGHFYGWYDE